MPDLLVSVRLDRLAARLASIFHEPCGTLNAASWLALRHPREVSQGRNLDVFRFRVDPTLILNDDEIAAVMPVSGDKGDAD